VRGKSLKCRSLPLPCVVSPATSEPGRPDSSSSGTDKLALVAKVTCVPPPGGKPWAEEGRPRRVRCACLMVAFINKPAASSAILGSDTSAPVPPCRQSDSAASAHDTAQLRGVGAAVRQYSLSKISSGARLFAAQSAGQRIMLAPTMPNHAHMTSARS